MISYLCKLIKASKSGYYNYLNSENQRNNHEQRAIQLKDIILKAFNHKGYKKGSRSIKIVLEQEFNMAIN